MVKNGKATAFRREASRKGCAVVATNGYPRGHEFSFKAPAAADKRDGGCGITLREKVRRRESGSR